MSAIVAATLLALNAAQKPQEVWRMRVTLHGKEVEIYDVMKGYERLGTGLREIVERATYYKPDRHKKYADILKPEWADIRIAKGKTILAKKERKAFAPVWIVPSKLDGKRIKTEKPAQTPYGDVCGGPITFFMGGDRDVIAESQKLADSMGYMMGLRSDEETGKQPYIEQLVKLHLGYQSGRLITSDVLDLDFNIKFTVANTRTLPHRTAYGWKVEYDTNDLAPLTQFLNDDGEPVSPEIPLIREFRVWGRTASEIRTVYAIPTSLSFERYIPILPDGRIKLETIPTAGYYPGYALRKPGEGGLAQTWLKEYITADGPRFGWANEDLTKETGPIWRSIVWWKHSTVPGLSGEDILAQLADGTWMIYDVPVYSTPEFPYRSVLDKPYPTREEAIRAFEPIYRKEKAEPILAQRRRDAEAFQRQFEEMTKYLEIDPSMNTSRMSAGELRSLLYQTIVTYNARLYNDFDAAYKKLPGDYYLKYLIVAYNLRRVAIQEADARKNAQIAVNPTIKATWLAIADRIKAEAEEAARRAEEDRKRRAADWADANKFAPRAPAGGSGWTSPWRDPYAPPSFSESSRRHEQYMNEMWKYLGGQQGWRPY